MHDQIRVRQANLCDSGDARDFVTLLDAYAADPMGGGRPLPEKTLARVIPALRRVPGCRVFLALASDQPIGFATCFTGFSTFLARPLLNVHDLAVLPAYRCRGIADSILQAVEHKARELGCCKITLEVREDNRAARALYRKHGFAAGLCDTGPVQYLFLEKRIPV